MTPPPSDPTEPADAAGGEDKAAGPDRDTGARFPDIADLGYEQARDELADTVRRLEGGQVDLETSVALWERGEALAAHCERFLDNAEARLRRDEPADG